ncbi:MAG: chemotaxis protein CheB, partial [Sphingomonadales bacterium]
AAGGTMLIQDPESAFAPAMPAAALARCPAAQSLPLDTIARYLVRQGAI